MEKQGIRFNPIPKNRRINIAIDSTGLKLVNDGEYRTKKYKKIKNWAKFHAAIHEGTQEALNIIITKDNVGDCRDRVESYSLFFHAVYSPPECSKIRY